MTKYHPFSPKPCPTARAILDHIFVPQQAPAAAADVPQRESADAQ